MESRREPLSGADHAWLRMESRVNPMVITSVIFLDGPIDLGRLEAVIAERLLPHVRFRQRVVPGLLGTPAWELDPYFELRNHVFREKLPPPGGRAWLEARVGELFGKPLDHRRPLWDLRVVEDFEGGSALIVRLHHAIADGMALLQILLSLTDAGDEEPRQPPPRRNGSNGFAPTDLLDPEKVIRLARQGVNGAAAIGRILLLPPERRTPIRGRLSSRKTAAWSEALPLPELKAIGKRVNGTVNDVLQAALAGALRGYLASRGLETRGRDVRTIVPVDLRPAGQAASTGNRFGLVFVDLPVGIPDPLERLRETKLRMDRIKASPEAAMIFGLLHAIGYAAPQVEAAALGLFGSKASAVVSNVPGPREARYLGGRKIKDILFWVPESGGIGMGVSFFGYHGKIRVGVVTDAALVPDPRRITEGFEAEIDRLKS